ncbi:AAA family ATPase [Deinococcus ficus]|uniref:AAA family ATPase n=1 Tax=Deinococcus ficus TaxID=317577 RepID=UPI001982F61F|nr:AAA family ATPase [Deinococcus ficus]GHF79820.1 hypothetical protein GCM10017782_17160 [Deinococcus ficus]
MQTNQTLPALSPRPLPLAGQDDVRREPPVPPVLEGRPEGRPAGGSLRRLRVDELMKTEFPPQQFIVGGLLPAGLCMLAGAPKQGKSWAALDLAVSVASGRPFLDRPTSQGAVLYLALEDTSRRLQERLKIIRDGVDWDALSLDLDTEIEPVNAGGLDALRAWLEEVENPRLIVIDVWGRFSPRDTSSKNEYDQITHTLQPLQALANEYGIAILLIHHTKKSNGESSMGGDPFDQIMGSRALTSNMDLTMMLTRTRMQREAVLAMTGRDVEEAELPLVFDRDTCRWRLTERVAGPALTPERQKVLDAVLAGHTKVADIGKFVRKERTAVANHLSALMKEGLLVRVATGEYGPPNQCGPEGVTSPTTPDMTDMGDSEAADSIADLV